MRVISSDRMQALAVGGLVMMAAAVPGELLAQRGDSAGETLHELRGRLTLTNRRGTKPSRSARPDDAVIFFHPRGGVQGTQRSADQGAAPEESAQKYELVTVGKQFSPSILVVPKGAEVVFPNRDPILHNVFSVSGDNRFDLDFYGEGESRSHIFDHAGLVRVYCNVHREMFAHVWVVDTPYVARPDSNGDFVLEGLPTTDGTLTYWHARSEVETLRLEGQRSVELQLPITKPRLPLHKNKFGAPYRRSSDYGGAN